MTQTTPTRDEALPTGWRYSINYGPDGEENFANVYAADGQFVGNLRTHHAIAICNAFAVCEKLASAPAPASGGVDADAAFAVASNLLRDGCTYSDRKAAADFIRSALSPAATPVSEAEPACWTSEVSLKMAAQGLPAVIHAYPPPVEPVALYRQPLAKPTLPAGGGMDLIRNLVIPMVSERSREPGDAWHQAEQVLASLSQSTSAGRVGE